VKPRPKPQSNPNPPSDSQPARKQIPRKQLERAAWLVFSLLLVASYCWTATSSNDPFEWRQPKKDFYNLLADAFLAGQLHLLVAPSPQMLALPNPYDPARNAGLRLHDASLYNGRYYLYFGPTPALVLFAPWKAITGMGIPPSFSLMVFATVGYVFSSLLLLLLIQAAEIQVPWFLKAAAVTTLGSGNLVSLLLRRPGAQYEVPILCGFSFFMAGMYLIARYLLAEDRKPWHALLAGLCFGLTAGCRPHYGPVAALLLAAYAFYLVRTRRLGGRRLDGNAIIREIAWFGGPVVFCGLVIAWYNFARFGNPLEFGTHYQLTASTNTRNELSFGNLLPCLYFFLFSRPVWLDQFPYLQLMRQPRAPFGHPEWMPDINLGDLFAGLLTIAPLCIAGFLLPLALLRKKAERVPAPVKAIVLALTGSAMLLLLSICLSGSVAMRYHVDFAPELLVAALLVCLWAVSEARSPRIRFLLIVLTAAGCLWGAAATTALSINGYDYSLRLRNPPAYRSLVSFFGGDPNTIRYPMRLLKLDAGIAFSPRPSSMREVLLASGSARDGDAVFVEYTGAGGVRFGFQHGDERTFGPTVAAEPGKYYQLSIGYISDAYDILTVKLNGQIALHWQGQFYFTAPQEITAGEDKTGKAADLRPFSGRLDVKDGGLAVNFGE
jgi:hypothetical protein